MANGAGLIGLPEKRKVILYITGLVIYIIHSLNKSIGLKTRDTILRNAASNINRRIVQSS
jgi:hypothetical protein